jgi:hypothetical protein
MCWKLWHTQLHAPALKLGTCQTTFLLSLLLLLLPGWLRCR